MRRTNTFSLAPTEKQEAFLMERADGCARLWNELTYRRRQSFFDGKINWSSKDLYDKYKGIVGSATAQQIQRKNNDAWKSFFTLLKMKKEGRLPEHIEHISPPYYWKDKNTGERKALILARCDCYRINGNVLKLPNKLGVEWKGNPKWKGKQGLLTIIHDKVRGKWYARQSVEVKPLHKPLSKKRAYIDLGVLELITVVVDGEKQANAYSGRPALADWWYVSHRIDELKSVAKETNGKRTTKQVRSLYKRRTLRFRQYVNTAVRWAVERLWRSGVAKIYVGDLKDIGTNVKGGRKTNTMVNNFWSHRYLQQRIREVAEEYGIKVELVNERGTSSKCPWCGSAEVVKRGRLLKCKACGIEAHRDVAGALNISAVCGSRGQANGVVAHPLEVRI